MKSCRFALFSLLALFASPGAQAQFEYSHEVCGYVSTSDRGELRLISLDGHIRLRVSAPLNLKLFHRPSCLQFNGVSHGRIKGKAQLFKVAAQELNALPSARTCGMVNDDFSLAVNSGNSLFLDGLREDLQSDLKGAESACVSSSRLPRDGRLNASDLIVVAKRASANEPTAESESNSESAPARSAAPAPGLRGGIGFPQHSDSGVSVGN